VKYKKKSLCFCAVYSSNIIMIMMSIVIHLLNISFVSRRFLSVVNEYQHEHWVLSATDNIWRSCNLRNLECYSIPLACLEFFHTLSFQKCSTAFYLSLLVFASTGIQSPDCPAHSKSLYRPRYPGPPTKENTC
jgi:hypothetical protein